MDLYCTKHKKKLAERFDTESKMIETYCVDCEMEEKYERQLIKRKERLKAQFKDVKNNKLLLAVGVSFIILLLLPIHVVGKVVFSFVFIVLAVNSFAVASNVSPSENHRPVWEDIRAQALNESSIQANKVDNLKRQWKKGFLQSKKNQKWTEEEWQQFLQQYYKKE